MKASKLMLATLKEAPQEAQISSHILLIRAGMIRKLVAGVYNYLPLGLRVLKKIENIIREEMDESGALEILSSAIQPKELWEESGRWSKYGPELIRFKDRHNREFCLGPTHEEIFTTLVKNEVKSYKSLPLNLYQIQTKYRDEIRPRFGLIRGREFIMKDSYSFDVDEEGLNQSYTIMYDTYSRIFDRLHINYQVVLADTGAIGGSESHQFMALSEIGESNIIFCDCGYAADEEKADTKDDTYKNDEEMLELEEVSTPNAKTIEEVVHACESMSAVKTGALIVYTSADSVFQIAAHTDIVPLEKLYEYCKTARNILVGEHAVGRVIARPFTGEYPFTRTADRHDFSVEPPEDTMLDILKNNDYDVISVGKIADIFANRGIKQKFYTHSNQEGMSKTSELLKKDFNGLVFTNLVDFDMKYGHRRDVDGYAGAITEFDNWLNEFIPKMQDNDLLIITADHGCDPAFKGTDHTREQVPLLIYSKNIEPENLGTIKGYNYISNIILDNFNLR